MGKLNLPSIQKMIDDIISMVENDLDNWTEIRGMGHPSISMEAFDEKLQTAIKDRGWKVSRIQRGTEMVLRIEKE